MNNEWNFKFHCISAVIQVACVVVWTSIFILQMIVVGDFFICWLEWFGLDWAVHCIVVFPQLFLASCSIGILLARCCLQMVAVARTWSKNFSSASSPIFTWGGSKYCPLQHLRRCSSHMACDAGIGWWRIWMTIADASLL